MDDIVLFTGSDLSNLIGVLGRIVNAPVGGVYEMRACVDEGGLKLKINNTVWTPAMGRMEVDLYDKWATE